MRHKHADVIHAWAEGEEVEMLGNGQWRTAKAPNFSEMYEYRIKPKKVKKEGWINIYEPTVTFLPEYVGIYRTEEEANEFALTRRVACIRIEWEEEE